MDAELDLVRPALELAIAVAREGASASPPLPPPRPLTPYLGFHKLPAKALVAAHRCLERDDAFRRRVVERAEGSLDEASRLLLERPEGWRDRLDELLEASRAPDRDAEDRRAAREVERLAEQVARLRRRINDLDAAHNTATQREAAARARIEALQQALEDSAEQLAAAEAARQRAVRELKDTERRLAERTAEVRELRERLGRLEAEASSVRRDAEERGDADRRAAEQAERRAGADSELLESLRERWAELGPALAEFQKLLSVPDQDVSRLLRAAQTAPPGEVPTTAAPKRRRDPGALRLPARIAPGTPAATRWLLSRPNVTVFVDGYNVTMLAWPELTAGEQRVLLERAARRLHAQLGCRIVLVFDGDDEGGREIRASVGSPVRVLFTARDVEADDEILARLDTTRGPALVVSNDRRVQVGALERGAHVIRAEEFVEVAR